MSVLLETTLGDIVLDLLVDHVPKLCENFLKLCKLKYYNFSPVHSVQKSFSFQTGDPLGPLSPQSDGGSSVWGLLSGDPAQRTFPALIHPKLKHLERGTVGMATVPHPTDPDVRLAASQFLVTLGENTDYLDGKSAIFGKVVEGFDVLEKINNAMVDSSGYPLVDIRIKHTVVLDDPYPDPAALRAPSASPPPSRAQLATVRIGEEEQAALEGGGDAADGGADDEAARDKARREREARAQALTLEMMGDLPFAEVKPPENVLFVCKLNPVTQDADLELIFSRFGTILSCEVIRDQKTGDSLQYAFIEFADKSACEAAYFKMQDVLIDDRRIHVDFSQSVSKLSDSWRHETNTKRQKQARGKGGWGGVRELEKWRKYRNDDDEDEDEKTSRYAMVHDAEDAGRDAGAASGPSINRDRDEARHHNGHASRGRDDKDRDYGRRRDDRDRNYGRGRDDRDRDYGRGRDDRGRGYGQGRDDFRDKGGRGYRNGSRDRDRHGDRAERGRGRDERSRKEHRSFADRSRSPRRERHQERRNDRAR